MTLEEKKQQYQKILVEEYRGSHPEETEGLTDEMVALMNPISDFDFAFLIGNELSKIKTEIDGLLEDIQYSENMINTTGTRYDVKAELQNDIVYARRRNAELEKKRESLQKQYDELRSIWFERDINDERNR